MPTVSSSPSSIVSNTGGWATTTNVYVSDNTYATNTGAVQNTEYPIEIGGYDFSGIVTGSIIYSVTVSIEMRVSSANRAQIKGELMDGTTVLTPILPLTTIPTSASEVTQTFQPVATLAQLKSANLKVRVTNKRTASQACTTSLDYVKIDVSYAPPPPSLTQAAYRFYADGTESASAAASAQDTAYTADVSSGDVPFQLRMRLQATTTDAVQSVDNFQLQYEKNASGTWYDVLSVAAGSGDSTPSYGSSTNMIQMGSNSRYAQSFIGNGQYLDQVKFSLSKGTGTPNGNDQAALWNHSGTYGTSSMPATVDPILLSDTVVPTSSLTTGAQVFTFTFPAGTRLVNGTPYCIGIIGTNTVNNSNYIASEPAASAFHAGNMASYTTATGLWTAMSQDLGFATVTTVPATAGIAPYDSANLVDGASTTNRLTGGTGTFQASKLSELGQVTNSGWSGNNHSELLYSLVLKAADVTNGDSLRFRVLYNGATTQMTYTQYPTINVTKTLVAISQSAYRFYADGTESGSTALAAQSTAPTVDLASGDLNLQLRILAQSTTIAAIPSTDDFQLQWEKNVSGTWTDVILPAGIAASYPDTYRDGSEAISSAKPGCSQSFIGDGRILTTARFLLNRNGSAIGTLRAVLYAHSGTYGSTGVPTGSALATSTTVLSVSSIPGAGVFEWFSFVFDETFTPTKGTPYCIALMSTGMDTFQVFVGSDDISSVHPGNTSVYTGSWAHASTGDLIFEVHTRPTVAPSTTVGYASPNLTDAAATTNRLTGGTGTFQAGKVSEDGLVDDLGWVGNNRTELLYSITLKQADLANSDTLRFRVLRNGSTSTLTYSSYPTINVTKVSLAISQAAYRFYNDDDLAASSTPAAAQDAGTTLSQEPIATTQLRFRLQSTSAAAIPATDDFQLQCEKNSSGTWVSVTTTESDVFAGSGYLLGSDPVTAARLSGGTGTFQNGKESITGLVSDLGWSGNNFTEVVFGVNVTVMNLANGDTFRFRLLKNGETTDLTYTQYPTINISTAPPPIPHSAQDVIGLSDVVSGDISGGVAITQAAYGFFTSNVSESAGVALAPQDSNHTSDMSVVGTTSPIALRFLMQSTTADAVQSTDVFAIQADKNNQGAWGSVTGVLLAYNSIGMANGEATTNRLTGGTGSFVTGQVSEDGAVDNLGWAGNSYTELVFSIAMNSSGQPWTHNDTVRFRVVRNGSTTGMTYSSYPSITVVVYPAAITQAAYQFYREGDANTSLQLAPQDTPASLSMVLDRTPLQLRVRMQSTSAPQITSPVFELQYMKDDSGTWLSLGTDVVPYDSSFLVDGGTASVRMVGGTGTGNLGPVSEDGTANASTFAGMNHLEALYSIAVDRLSLAQAANLKFRVLWNGSTDNMTYSQTPTLAVTVGPLVIDVTDSISVYESLGFDKPIEYTPPAGFPVIKSRVSGSQTSGQLNHRITTPSEVVPGDLLVVCLTWNQYTTAPAINASASSSGWLAVDSRLSSLGHYGAVYSKIATGDDRLFIRAADGTSVNIASGHIAFCVSGAQAVLVASASGGASTSSNPPLLTGTGTKNTLWIAARFGSSAASVVPTGFINRTQKLGLGTVETVENYVQAASMDPAAWTQPSARWVAATLGIEPIPILDVSDSTGLTDTFDTQFTPGAPAGLDASATVGITDTFSTVFPTAAGRPKVWTGSAYAPKPGKYWNGSAWVEKPWKRWTGSEWKPVT